MTALPTPWQARAIEMTSLTAGEHSQHIHIRTVLWKQQIQGYWVVSRLGLEPRTLALKVRKDK
jgi:hypothetical protein